MAYLQPAPQLAPGVWRITTPLPFRPREAHAYLVRREEGGWMLVDGGVNTDEAWAVLDRAVREIAQGWQEVDVHLVTHMHLDHIGLVERVRDASGARLLMGALDAERAAHATAHPDEEAEYRAVLLRESGAPEELRRRVQEGRRESNPLSSWVPVDESLSGEIAPVPGATGWKFVWTPGHTAGHVSLWRAADRLLIAGDAVLPRITPTLGVNRQREDPIGDYLDALCRLEELEPVRILPGHGDAIEEPAQRLEELRGATLQETRRIVALLTDTSAPAWEVARRRYADRELPSSARMLALRETLAHLRHLVRSGRARVRSAENQSEMFVRA